MKSLEYPKIKIYPVKFTEVPSFLPFYWPL